MYNGMDNNNAQAHAQGTLTMATSSTGRQPQRSRDNVRKSLDSHLAETSDGKRQKVVLSPSQTLSSSSSAMVLIDRNIHDFESHYDICVALVKRGIDDAFICWIHQRQHPMAQNAERLYMCCNKPKEFTCFQYFQCNQFTRKEKEDLLWLMAALRCRHMTDKEMAHTIRTIREKNGGKLFREHR